MRNIEFSLFSTRAFCGRVEELTVELVKKGVANFNNFCLAFGYYEVDLCKEFFMDIAKKQKINNIRLIFNGFSGPRVESQINELKDLADSLIEIAEKVEIKLSFQTGLFHTKLLIASNEATSTSFIGSANFTYAAFYKNEEIWVQITPSPDDLVSYFNRVWADEDSLEINSIDTSKEVIPPSDITSFFRTGTLFFKPTALLPSSINPFTEFLSSLSDVQKGTLGSVPLPFSEGSTGIGPFNIKRSLNLGDDTEDLEKSGKKFSIKPFSIETCFGFWVPEAVLKDLYEKMDEVSSERRKYYADLQRKYREKKRIEVEKDFRTYFQRGKSIFIERGIDFSKFLKSKDLVDFVSEERISKFFDNFEKDLDSEPFIQKLCSPFVVAPMPELADDPNLFKEFSSSFYDYLSFLSNKIDRKTPRVPRKIFEALEINSAISSDEIAELFQSFFETYSWPLDYW